MRLLPLDENRSPTLAAAFLAAGHEAHSVLEQALGGVSDPHVIVCYGFVLRPMAQSLRL